MYKIIYHVHNYKTIKTTPEPVTQPKKYVQPLLNMRLLVYTRKRIDVIISSSHREEQGMLLERLYFLLGHLWG